MRLGWYLVLLTAACGRVGFDARDDAGLSDAGPDAYTGCPVVAASAGREHTCALDMRGNVWCFGDNTKGQVIAGGPPFVVEPTKISLPGQVVQLAAGRAFTCARMLDGNVWCWGENVQGEHGDGGNTNVGPSQVMLGPERAVDIAAGAHDACAIRQSDGAVMCWGLGQFFATGQATTGQQLVPAQIMGGSDNSKKLAIGHRSACVIGGDDQVRCWGRNNVGQLGTSDGVDRGTSATVPGLGTAQSIAVGGIVACAVDTNHNVRCWGDNAAGGLGTGDEMPVSGLTGTVGTNAAAVMANSSGWCARTSSGELSCTAAPFPGFGGAPLVATTVPITGVTDVMAGFYHQCVIAQNALQCWGSNIWGQLGRGSRSIRPLRTIPLTGVTKMSVGASHVCAIASDGLSCWGNNYGGQLATGTQVGNPLPVKITTPLANIAGVTVGDDYTCAWDSTGALACWGNSSTGRLGFSSTSKLVTTPTVVSAVSGVLEAGAGSAHTCVRTATQILCFGSGGSGELGNNTMNDSVTPVVAQNTNGATSLSVGANFNCVIVAGAVRCWGQNGGGQIGNGSTAAALTAQTVTMPGTAVSVSAGTFHTCAINDLGDLYCWGLNRNGEVGVGDTAMRTLPVKVTLPAQAASVVTSQYATCARLVDNSVYCWGGGAPAGMLGVESSLVPSHVAAADGAVQLARSTDAVCMLDAQNTMKCWGEAILVTDAQAANARKFPAPAAIPACP
ncbi:MAG TPA: hypothetical protein VL326_11360 [Kofleriaceae bacterium]|nr:hypothetical protein [Kofleriaceae bacterium]